MGAGGTLFLEARELIRAGASTATGTPNPLAKELPEMMSGPPTRKWRRDPPPPSP